jgi:hypothetical protein
MSDVLRDLQVTHTRENPVYVIGYPRSGTSVTCRLLRRYLKVSFGTESQFVVRYHRRLSRYGDLNDDDNLRRLIKDISAERFLTRSQRNFGFIFDPTRAFSEVEERSYSGVLHAIFSQLAEHNGMVRWGDKTPEYNNHLPLLRRLFPDAQFVHIVRDGRDVDLSIRRIGFGPKNAYETASQWARTLRTIRSFAGQLPSDQYFELRYEDLTDRPAEMLAALADFLGIDDSAGELRDYIRRRIASDVKTDNLGKWRRELPARDVERFEAIAGPQLAHFDYELVFGASARRISAPERVYWHLHGWTARLLMAGCWSDNWYKLRLRARTLSPHLIRRAATVCQTVFGRSTGA